MLRFLTAGESHGQALVMTLDGMPAGLELDIDALNAQLRRRQGGYGRGRRMQIESDRAEILAGVRHGRTTGAPIALLIRNRDWVNWQQTMYVEARDAGGRHRREARRRHAAAPRPRRPRRRHQVRPRRHPRRARARQRPRDRRRASPPAALARQLLGQFGVRIASHVSAIGDVVLPARSRRVVRRGRRRCPTTRRCAAWTRTLQQRMIAVHRRREGSRRHPRRRVRGHRHRVPPGLGSYVQWDRKLDGRLGAGA